MGQGCTGDIKEKEEAPTGQVEVVAAGEEKAAVAFSPDVACHGSPSVTTATRSNTITSSSSNETMDALKESLLPSSSDPNKSISSTQRSQEGGVASAVDVEGGSGTVMDECCTLAQSAEEREGGGLRGSQDEEEEDDDDEEEEEEEEQDTSIIGATPTSTIHARATQGSTSVLISALKSQQLAKENENDDAPPYNVCAEETTISVSMLRKGDRCGSLRRWSSPATVMVSVPTAPQNKSVIEQILARYRERNDELLRRNLST